MNKNEIVIKDLTKIFEGEKIPSLDSINVNISSGVITGIIGPDGAGKTTLVRTIVGLLKPTQGSVKVHGYDTIANANDVHKLISYMPQKAGLYEDLTVLQNLVLYANLKGLPKEQHESTFNRLLEFTNLKQFTSRFVKNLSGGMKQKLGLACALVKSPKVLILDEPGVGVDPIARRELWQIISDLRHESISVIFTTSYLDEAERCDSVVLLNEGKLLYFGAPDDLTNKLKGRTFLVQNVAEKDKRKVLFNALDNELIVDSIVQGSAVRLVLKSKDHKPTLKDLGANNKAELVSAPPRFEDAFVDVLGGSPKGISNLAELFPKITGDHDIVIKAEGLVKKFGDFTAVNNISFAVKHGEIFGLLGPNGAGKSTTFKMLCGLLKPTQGSSSIAGFSLQEAPSAARAKIGYMAQKFSLYEQMSLLQNLVFFSGVYQVSSEYKEKIINEIVETFNFKPHLNSPAGMLSLGFKQRLALSCALMHHPKVLFLDEPTAGVDPLTRREFWFHINKLVDKGITVLITTHFMDEAEYCDRIGLVNFGKLLTIGTPDDLKARVISKQMPNPTLEDAFIALSSNTKEII